MEMMKKLAVEIIIIIIKEPNSANATPTSLLFSRALWTIWHSGRGSLTEPMG
jgi:hypothetical protein